MSTTSRNWPDLKEQEVAELGRRLGEALFPNARLALIGPLGAGKTFFARALAEGLGVADPRVVTSPTFVLIQEYVGRLPIYHFDVYRLPCATEFMDLGVHEYFASDGVCLIEWADRVADYLPSERLEVHLEPTSERTRNLEMIAYGPRYCELLKTLA